MKDMKINKKYIVILLVSVLILSIGGTLALNIWASGNTTLAGNTMCFDIKYAKGQDISFSNMTASLTFDESSSASTTIGFARQNGCLLYGKGTITANISTSVNLSTGALKYKIVNNATSEEVASGSITNTGDNIIYDNFDIIDSITYVIYFWLDSNYIDNTYLEASFSGTVEASAVSTKEYGDINDVVVETAAEKVTNLYNDATKTPVTTAGGEAITQATSVGLEQDSFGNIRYYGANPNNYVSFNDELWRIIGVFDVEDENGKVEKRVKIARNESIGDFAYDNKPSGIGTSDSEYGSNDWTDARLMMLLNPGYETTSSLYAYEGSLYWNRKSGTCYAGESEGTKSCDFTSTGLTTTAQSMIGKAKYYLGGSSDISGLYADDYYNFERGTTLSSGHATTWTGYVGIMYPSDYAYATDLSVCTKYGDNYDSDTTNCGGKDWLLNSRNWQWTLSTASSDSSGAFIVNTSGYVRNDILVFNAGAIRPVLYLKSDISISGGEGTSSKPYTLESPPPTAVEKVTNLYNDATKTAVTTAGGEAITQATSVGLEQDSFGNIRYYGKNPNNYVSFNDELWRIIGVFDVEDETGKVEKRVKIARNESIGDFAYDNKPSGTGTSDDDIGSNDWTDARLMMLLNPGYESASSLYAYEGSLYWNRKSGTCYAGSSGGTKSCDFTSTGLTTTAQSMIGKAKYYLGGSSTYEGLYADDYYNFERGTTVYSGHATTWTGYVGIMYPSDYAYATDLRVCTKDGYNYDGDTTNCGETDWLLNSSTVQWTLSPDSSNSYIAFRVSTSGFVGSDNVYNAGTVRPVLYLKSDISISGGEGTNSKPYTLS